MSESFSGKRILLTRITTRAEPLAKMIRAQQGIALLYPLFKIEPVKDRQELQKTGALLDNYDFVVFTSPSAVEHGLPTLLSQQPWPEKTRVLCVGKATADLLKKNGIRDIIVPDHSFDSEGLLAEPALDEEMVHGKSVLILRAQSGRAKLAECLRQRGALVDFVACYERIGANQKDFLSFIRNNVIDALTIFSSEGLYMLRDLADTGICEKSGRFLRRLPLFTPHDRTAALAEDSGWQQVIKTGFNDLMIVKSLLEYKWHENE